MDIFGQSLELGKQAHLFWDFNVRDISAYVFCVREITHSDAHVLCTFLANLFR